MPNPNETAQHSFIFEQFLRIDVWSYILHAGFIEKCARQLLKYFELFGPLSLTLAKTDDGGFTFEQFLSIEI